MTIVEFERLAHEGLVVQCQTPQQRREILELFDNCGFVIGANSKKHLLPNGDRDVRFMHPGTNSMGAYITCYRNFELAKEDVVHAISYEDICNLIGSPPKIDERSDAEFAEDFSLLMRSKPNGTMV